MDNDLIELLEGEFVHTVYRSDNYMVARFKTDEGTITVTGPSFDFEKNTKYILSGSYVEHYKYGFQFNILTVEKYIATKKEEIVSFLKSKTFPGIGKKAAEKIYDFFGNDTLRILKEDPSRIFEVDLTEKQLLSLQSGFEAMNDPQNEIMLHLVSNGFNNSDAQRIYNRYKYATMEIAEDNPFRFYHDVYGVSFDKVRNYASRIEFSDAENKYKEAYLIYLIKEYCFSTGDIYLKKNELIRLIEHYGGMDNLEEIISRCLDQKYLYQENERYYIYSDYFDEAYIAQFLNHFEGDLFLDDVLIQEGIGNCENDLQIRYDEKQKEAIANFFSEGISIITGGPGTGKTTIVKTMVTMFRDYFPFSNLMVVAPTGRAAKRINEICDVESKTIHSLLRWNKETNTFVFDVDNPILYDALIIDEFSMVDNNLFACLLKASGRIKKICIIGDNNQLPSIKPGNLLNDLISSGKIPVCHLESNYRQSQGNEIISLANDIIRNDVELSRYNKDIVFYDINRSHVDLISLIQKDLEEGNSLDDVQILAPMYKGLWGIDNMNIMLQSAFNPADFSKKERRSGKYIYRENDKILQLKNRPSEDVYNGDIGILEDIDEKEKSLMVNYAGTYVFYPFEDLSDISLAYALSVHKSQGSEYRIVYFIFNRNNIHMLNRNLIYTAISRAKNKLVIIGDESLFKQSLNHMIRKRHTSLLERLENE